MASKTFTLITGASKGIGAQFAIQLAAKGHNLILVARSESGLNALRDEIAAAHPDVIVHVLPRDLNKPGAPHELFEATKAWPVSLLVNNAGFGHEVGVAFVNQTIPGLEEMMHVNMSVLTIMCRLYLPGIRDLLRADPKLVGGIINIASLFAFQAVPWTSAYAATKAYVLNFTEAISYEATHAKEYLKGLHIIAICPGPVKTAFWDKAGASPTASVFAPVTPERVAEESIAAWYKGGRTNWTITWAVATLCSMGAFLPKSLNLKIWGDGSGGERAPEA